jgi:hypothetical protein
MGDGAAVRPDDLFGAGVDAWEGCADGDGARVVGRAGLGDGRADDVVAGWPPNAFPMLVPPPCWPRTRLPSGCPLINSITLMTPIASTKVTAAATATLRQPTLRQRLPPASAPAPFGSAAVSSVLPAPSPPASP